MSAETAPTQALHRAWVLTGIGLLGAGVLAPMVLARPGVPSARSFVHHCTTAATPRLDPGWILGAFCTAFVLYAGARALAALRRVVRAEGALRQLHGETHEIDGRRVVVVAGQGPAAFCGGLLRPRVYLTRATFAMLSDDEMRAVVAHEEHHRHRREPLRLAARVVVRELLFFVPVLGPLDARLRVEEELRADEAAVIRASGDRRPIASALLRFDAAAPGSCVLAERVDGLTGTSPPWRAPRGCGVRSAAHLAVLGIVGAVLAFTAQGTQLIVLQACSVTTLGIAASGGLSVRLARRARAGAADGRRRPVTSGVSAD